MTEIESIVIEQVDSKVNQLSDWKKVRWEGGRVYYESTNIMHEIAKYDLSTQIFYLETLRSKTFQIFDNWPHESPDVTASFRNWLDSKIAQLKINSLATKSDFLQKDFGTISLAELKLENSVQQILENRINEIQYCLNAKAHLSAIILSGSVLEGVLFGVANNNHKDFNCANAAPKDKFHKTKRYSEWTLDQFINVAFEIGYLDEDIKRFTSSLRDFRNYIHPYEELASKFTPTEQTAKICWQVLSAAIFQIEVKIRASA